MMCPKPTKRAKSPRKPLSRSGKIQGNAKRKKRAFQEDFGGKEYLAFIHSLPCDVCGARGWTVAAHLTSRGAGGKADVIAPLCSERGGYWDFQFIRGCHARYDDHDPAIRAHEPNLRKLAAERWQSHITENE